MTIVQTYLPTFTVYIGFEYYVLGKAYCFLSLHRVTLTGGFSTFSRVSETKERVSRSECRGLHSARCGME